MELGATDLNGTDLNGQRVLAKIQAVFVTASTAVRQGRAFALLRHAAAQAAPSLHRVMALGKSIVATPSAHAWRQIRPAALAVQSAAVTSLRRRVGLVASVAQSCALSIWRVKVFKVYLLAAATAAVIFSRSITLRRTATAAGGVRLIRRISLHRLVSAVSIARKTITRLRTFLVSVQSAVTRLGRFAVLAELGASHISIATARSRQTLRGAVQRVSLARSIVRDTVKAAVQRITRK